MFFLIVYQIISQAPRDVVPPASLAIHSRRSPKWLNIVLDLNGVFCQCMERSAAVRYGHTFCEDEHLYSSHIPTLVGPKGVYSHPRVRDFLRLIGTFAARILIWSSMKTSTVEHIVRYLFHDIPPPFGILGQNQCTNIKIKDGQFVFSFNKNKLIFLKILPHQLFSTAAASSPFSNENTILIDDSPDKSVCNKTGNAIFLESWSRHHIENDFLLGTLTLWLSRLNMYCMPGELRKYVDQNQIGSSSLAADDPLLLHMMRGMVLSAKNVGVHYFVLGVPDLNSA